MLPHSGKAVDPLVDSQGLTSRILAAYKYHPFGAGAIEIRKFWTAYNELSIWLYRDGLSSVATEN